MTRKLFNQTQLTEMNQKAKLIQESQSARLRDRQHYMDTLKKYDAHDGLLYQLTLRELKGLVGEL